MVCAYWGLAREEFKSVDIKSLTNGKEVIEIGGDTERAISDWSAQVKKLFKL